MKNRQLNLEILAAISLLCLLTVPASVRADDSTSRSLKALNRHVENIVRNLPHYRHRLLEVVTETDRGGSIEGFWKQRKLQALNLDVWVSNKNYTYRFILQSHKIVAVDKITELFNPTTQNYYSPRKVTQVRYLYDDKHQLYKANKAGNSFTKPDTSEYNDIQSTAKMFLKLEQILKGNKRVDISEELRGG